MRLRIFVTVMVYLLIPNILFGVNNTIKGEILDANTKKPLQNANVVIDETAFGTASDFDGKFIIQNIPPGNYSLAVTFIGYKTYKKEIQLMQGEVLSLKILLESSPIEGKEVVVTAKSDVNLAIMRETPIAFTTLELKELKHNYTTGDLPDLIQNVPGVWTSSAGLGESEIKIRGFSSDKVRFLVNGIPMNEAEDQLVYWSNWTGLSNIVRSVQVQRGAGFSLYGTGAFGGSVLIETIGVSSISGSFIRTSAGGFDRMGIASGPRRGLVAHPECGNGFVDAGSGINYTYSCRLHSGPIFGNKLNMSVFFEYKTGDSYIFGTGYNGLTLGLEAQSIFKSHQLDFTFFTSPQGHNQAFALQDIGLLESLGREYNRKRHQWQENYYRKPFFNLKHEWKISEKQKLISNGFFSIGKGIDQTVANDIFDVKTGTVDYRSGGDFGRHALYLYENFGIITTGFYPPNIFNFTIVNVKENYFTDQRMYGWQDRKQRNHLQYGLSTYFYSDIHKNLKIILGGESRLWRGHRTREAWTGAFHDNYREGWRNFGEYPTGRKLQNIYDYNTEINNFSMFGRLSMNLLKILTIQAGGQLYYSHMKVIENPIQFFDFGKMEFFEDVFLRTTADKEDSLGNYLYKGDDYKRTYRYFSPWIGSNLNLSQRLNFFMNLATAKKEPAILDWYDFSKGPRSRQEVDQQLKAESAVTLEFGLNYQISNFEASINYYRTQFQDKIETVVDFEERRNTINAGKALFQGVELELDGEFGIFDFGGSATFARNRWQNMDVQEIFGVDATDVEGKVIPFSPEIMANVFAGYYFTVHQDHHYRLGFDINFWDEYYGTYTNEYKSADGLVYRAKLPYFLDIGAHLSFTKTMPKYDVTFRLDANNLFNRKDNFLRAQYTIDWGRNDYYNGKYHWYVLQAPLFNIFFTAEVAIR